MTINNKTFETNIARLSPLSRAKLRKLNRAVRQAERETKIAAREYERAQNASAAAQQNALQLLMNLKSRFQAMADEK
jgi:uncharacterized membrane protein